MKLFTLHLPILNLRLEFAKSKQEYYRPFTAPDLAKPLTLIAAQKYSQRKNDKDAVKYVAYEKVQLIYV